MQLALAAAAASSGLGEDLGGTAALGGGLVETFQRLLPGTFFFFFSFSQESATATAEERKTRKRLLLEPMQPFGSPGGASLPG